MNVQNAAFRPADLGITDVSHRVDLIAQESACLSFAFVPPGAVRDATSRDPRIPVIARHVSMTNPPPRRRNRSIHFHNSFDARPRERETIRNAICDSAPELSGMLAPEWIVVRAEVDDCPLYLVHARTTRRTMTVETADGLANKIENGVFE